MQFTKILPKILLIETMIIHNHAKRMERGMDGEMGRINTSSKVVLNEFLEASEYAGIDESQIEEAKNLISDCDELLMSK